MPFRGEEIAVQDFPFERNLDRFAPSGPRGDGLPECDALTAVGVDEARVRSRPEQEHISAAIVVGGAQKAAVGAEKTPGREADLRGAGDAIGHRQPSVAPTVGARLADAVRGGETFAEVGAAGVGVPGGSQPLGIEERIFEWEGHGRFASCSMNVYDTYIMECMRCQHRNAAHITMAICTAR